jgi:hypothetical protein
VFFRTGGRNSNREFHTFGLSVFQNTDRPKVWNSVFFDLWGQFFLLPGCFEKIFIPVTKREAGERISRISTVSSAAELILNLF